MIDRAPVADLRVDWNDIALHEAAERRKLREMVNFAYHEKCLRQFILRYFGDRKDAANCRCSNCQPNLKWSAAAPAQQKPEQKNARKPSPDPGPANILSVGEDAPRPVGQSNDQAIDMISGVSPRALSDDEHLVARKILSCIARMEGKYGKGMVAGVLRGAKAKNIIANELDQLTTYGLLKFYSQDELTRFINALIVAGCVRQTGGAIPTVGLTTLGAAVMRDQARVELDLEAVEADTSDEEITLPPNYSETHEQTYALYQQGLGIDEIAEKRNLKTSTIENHLAALIEEGRDIDLSNLVGDQDLALIEAAVAKAQLAGLAKIEGLRPIKDQLPERIGYNSIRFVVADIKRRQKN
jgi:superfamily II DNA helicase RecQ